MTIEQELEKEGIQVIRCLDTLAINSIAKFVATKLVKTFPNQNLNYDLIFITLSKLNMYIATMPSDLSSAKYYYRNHAIYFRDTYDFSHLDCCMMHECIHALQECRSDNNHLIRLGLCDFTSSKLPGMALNEAAVQLMSAYTFEHSLDTVKYFDITLPTYSSSHYALECTLLAQMTYITGTYSLFHSTLYSNDVFKNKFISLTNKETYYKIERNLDQLLDLEDHLNFQTSLLSEIEDNSKNITKLTNRITKLRKQIRTLFIETQNVILTNYFDKKFENITTCVQIENYRKKLYNFKDYIGYTSDYTFYNDYYITKMADLELKHNEIENMSNQVNPEFLLVPTKQPLFITLIKKLKKLFTKKETYQSIHLN